MNVQQRAIATKAIAQLNRSRKVATRLESGTFYPAEPYHQDFARKNPDHGYIVRWDAPKVSALKKMYPGVWQASFLRD